MTLLERITVENAGQLGAATRVVQAQAVAAGLSAVDAQLASALVGRLLHQQLAGGPVRVAVGIDFSFSVELLGGAPPDPDGLPMRTAQAVCTRVDQDGTLLRLTFRRSEPSRLAEEDDALLVLALENATQRSDVERLTRELEDTNRGVVALLTELEEKAEALRRSSELKTRFLNAVSHELRTPIHSILNLAGLLQRRYDGPLTPEQERQVGFIRQAAESLSELLNDLLDLAKIEAGRVAVKPSEFTLEELFMPLRGLMRSLPRAKEVTLSFDFPPGLPPLYGDEGKLGQILRNLISNALKFTARGEVRVSASLQPEDRIAFCVRDTGVGIAARDLERIFDEFVQLESPATTASKGTGLGLPLSRKLAELMGGTLTVQSAPGDGSTFTCVIPLRLDLARVSGVQGRRLLVVDPDPLSRQVIGRMLSPLGVQTEEAADAGEALERIAGAPPDALVLELELPGMDGWQLIERLRSVGATRSLPVLVRTSLSLSPIDRERLSLFGATSVGKDATPERVADALRGLLEKQGTGRL